VNYDVSIVIVTYNSEEQIKACLTSISRSSIKIRHQIIVVDNNSQDQTVEIIKSDFPAVHLIVSQTNLGFSKGVNLGARSALGDFILLLNPDTVVLNSAIEKIVEFARHNPSYLVYGGRTLKPDGSLEPSSCWDLPSVWSMLMFATGLSTLAPSNRWLAPESIGGWQRDTIREVGMITGCFLLVQREFWITLRGLNERYFMYGEDADFALRARRAGARPVIFPGAEVIHEIGKSSSTPIGKALLLYRGKASLIRNYWPRPSREIGLAFLIIGVFLRALPRVLTPQKSIYVTLLLRMREWLTGY